MKLVSADLHTKDIESIKMLVNRMPGITMKQYVRMSIILTTEAMFAVMKLEQAGNVVRDSNGNIPVELVRETLVQVLDQQARHLKGVTDGNSNSTNTDASV